VRAGAFARGNSVHQDAIATCPQMSSFDPALLADPL